MQEWFENDQRGLEHGFTLRERPLLTDSHGDEAQTSAHGSRQSGPVLAASSLNSQPSTLNLLLRVCGGLRTEGFDRFGYSVAISGDTVVIAAPSESSAATGVDGNSPLPGTAFNRVKAGNQ